MRNSPKKCDCCDFARKIMIPPEIAILVILGVKRQENVHKHLRKGRGNINIYAKSVGLNEKFIFSQKVNERTKKLLRQIVVLFSFVSAK